MAWNILQEEDQVCNLVNLWQSPGNIGTALGIALAWAQHQTGVGFPLFHLPGHHIDSKLFSYLPYPFELNDLKYKWRSRK